MRKKRTALRRAAKYVGEGAGAATLLSLAYIGASWARYGKAPRNRRRDSLLDRFMPAYEVLEVHETDVAAPAAVTYSAAHDLDLRRSGVIQALFRGRELLMRSTPTRREAQPTFLSEVQALGWRVLAENPGRELVIGAVTQPWKPNVEFRGLEPDEFVAFNEPGYAKIAWTIEVEPVGDQASIFRTETRVATTDPKSRRRFRRYWSVVSLGVVLIRYEILRLVKREASRRLTAEPSTPS
jgi:hypothetical protein